MDCSSSSAFKTPLIIFLRLASKDLLWITIEKCEIRRRVELFVFPYRQQLSVVEDFIETWWNKTTQSKVQGWKYLDKYSIWGGLERHEKSVSLQFGLPDMKPAEQIFHIWKYFLSRVLSQTLWMPWIPAICQKQFPKSRRCMTTILLIHT